MGGPDLAGNPSLELAVTKAKKTSVPADNIDRAIKRGAGLTGEVVDYTEIMYECRGPQGSALLIECLTDNKNRAASEVRLAISRNGGTIADPGSVSYLFSRKGVVSLPKNDLSEDDVLMAVPTPVPRKSRTTATASRSTPSPPTCRRSAMRSRKPGSTTTPTRPSLCRPCRCRWTSKPPRNS